MPIILLQMGATLRDGSLDRASASIESLRKCVSSHVRHSWGARSLSAAHHKPKSISVGGDAGCAGHNAIH